MDKNFELEVKIPFNGTLDILVENMGRINYGSELPHNKKGIVEPVYINDYEITGNWKMFNLPRTNNLSWVKILLLLKQVCQLVLWYF